MQDFNITIGDKVYCATLTARRGTWVSFVVKGKQYEIELAPFLKSSDKTLPVSPAKLSSTSQSGGDVRAPIPGIVIAIVAKEGQKVVAGDTVLVLEAMKMENNIAAGSDGVVGKVHVNVGQEVDRKQLLLSVIPAA